jgi:phosphoesterase RecJ-like protein
LHDEFIKKLKQYGRVLLTTHESPDADGIGAVLALAWYLRGLGKETRIIASSKLPWHLKFMDTEGWVEAFDPACHGGIDAWPDCWLVADANEPGRLGPLKGSFDASKAVKACIDHHLRGELDAFDFTLLNQDASSACELVMEALGASSIVGPEMAQALYAGMVDDTGGFRFQCTTPKVLRMAAKLLDRGVRTDAVNRGLYNQATPAKMRIFGMAYNNLSLYSDEQLAVLSLSLDDLKSAGATHEDLEGLVGKPLELRTVEVSVLAYERHDGRIKISMRSKTWVDVDAISRLFGGGGHHFAAGAVLPGPMEQTLGKVVLAIMASLEVGPDSSPPAPGHWLHAIASGTMGAKP